MMPYCRSLACRLQAVDSPNERKIHDKDMVKCGGMAMVIGAMGPILLWAPIIPFTKAVLIGSAIIVFFGILDDIKDLGPQAKFGGQIAAGVIAVFVGEIKITTMGNLLPVGFVLPDWFAIPFTIFVIVGVVNATNFADGLDGLAGGISLLIFIFIGYLGFLENDFLVTMVAMAIGGAIFGFLRFNTHPAELFMGDAGSQLLGFLSILLLIKLTQGSATCSAVLPLIVIGLPIMDTIAVMARRLATGKSPFRADKNHFHHQLIEMGMYHSEAVLTIYSVQAFLIVVAIIFQEAGEWILLLAYLVFSFILMGSIFIIVKTNFHLNRTRYLDPFKAKLRAARERGAFIKICFGAVKLGVPFLLLFNCLVSAPIPSNYSYLPILLFIAIVSIWSFNRSSVNNLVRLTLYILTPYLVYAAEVGIIDYFDRPIIRIYNLFYMILFIFVLLTVNLTRRKSKFKSSTMDFLVVFIILLVPNLPYTGIQDYQLGLVAIKIIVFFFSYEVLLGELRIQSQVLPITTTMALLLLFSVKSVFLAG